VEVAVLSRIAESLYWIGRATERAEDTARLLDVHYHHLLEDRFADERMVCTALLRAMGVDVPDARDADAVLRHLAFAPNNPGSIVASLEVAWENARGAREALSSEMWEVLNRAHLNLANRVATAVPHEFFRDVRDRMAVLAGLADATLARDEGWRFLVLGRNLERIDMSARILSARIGSESGGGWITTLRCASAYEAFLRTYRRSVDPSSAAEFLLLDHLFPRSVMHAFVTCERVLEELAPNDARSRVADEARRRAGIARAELEFLRVDDLVATLPDQIAMVQRSVAAMHEAIAARYFLTERVVEWSA
jgi:uncharacterized alpha-E superfamily protein